MFLANIPAMRSRIISIIQAGIQDKATSKLRAIKAKIKLMPLFLKSNEGRTIAMKTTMLMIRPPIKAVFGSGIPNSSPVLCGT
jgi:hypothetical protein